MGATLHRGARASHYRGLSLAEHRLGSRRAGSVIVAHGPICSAACGIFPDQGSNPCPLRWQADSQPLRHQGSPIKKILNQILTLLLSLLLAQIHYLISLNFTFSTSQTEITIDISERFCENNWFYKNSLKALSRKNLNTAIKAHFYLACFFKVHFFKQELPSQPLKVVSSKSLYIFTFPYIMYL